MLKIQPQQSQDIIWTELTILCTKAHVANHMSQFCLHSSKKEEFKCLVNSCLSSNIEITFALIKIIFKVNYCPFLISVES